MHPFNSLYFFRTAWVSWLQEPFWILMKQEMMGGSFFKEAGCPSCRPTNSVKTLK